MAPKTLQMVSNDLFDLTQQFKDHKPVASMHSFKLLQRILNEQCTVSSSEHGCRVSLKEPKQIPSDSLQNPSDPDAGYSGHKGQGYQVQVMETYTDTDDQDQKAKTLNLITHVAVESAHESDANALVPAIESAKARDLTPKQLLADSLYGSDENVEKGKDANVEVIAPTMGSEKKETISLGDFATGKGGRIITCPKGHTPISVKKKKTWHCAAFNLNHCGNCPNQDIGIVPENEMRGRIIGFNKHQHYIRCFFRVTGLTLLPLNRLTVAEEPAGHFMGCLAGEPHDARSAFCHAARGAAATHVGSHPTGID